MDSITFIVFGGTGDLARKKLAAAINQVCSQKKMTVNLLGIGRKPFDDKSYKEYLEKSESKFKFDNKVKVMYYRADFSEPETFAGLSAAVTSIESEDVIGRVFYLAISPEFFPKASQLISRMPEQGFTRIMLEKPFGYDYASSEKINKELQAHFKEEQIYRVDHYLAKETVENILLMRFSNPLFENTWNSNFIDKIKITVMEDIGVGERISYYDTAGAIRDMVQNHILQVLLFILMDPPAAIDPHLIAEKKLKAIKALRYNHGIRGQYSGYYDELKTMGKHQSSTETYAEVHLQSNDKRWKGTEIMLKTGKNMKEKEAHITLEYKKEPCILYCSFDTAPNKLIFRIQPSHNIELTMNTKVPNDPPSIEKVRMTFSPSKTYTSNSIESYIDILTACMEGDKNLFIRSDILRESWKLTDKIVKKLGKQIPIIYKEGTEGPAWNLNR